MSGNHIGVKLVKLLLDFESQFKLPPATFIRRRDSVKPDGWNLNPYPVRANP
jgi:hypothetical protein